MSQQPSAYHRPQTLAEAIGLLEETAVYPLGGGTKLLAGDVQGEVVDLQDLNLATVQWGDGVLRVGAMVTLTDLTAALADAPVAGAAALLADAIHRAGANTYRNAATIGGTIASRLADSELLSTLLVLEAVVVIGDEKQVALADYLADEGMGGLITAVVIPWTDGTGKADRVARTPADYPIVSVVMWQPAGGAMRLAGTGMNPLPSRLTAAEAADDKAAAAKAASTHAGDFRGDAAYRAEMTAVLVGRCI